MGDYVNGVSIDYVVFFKQKTAYEMRISDWSSDVCSSDLGARTLRFYPCCRRAAGMSAFTVPPAPGPGTTFVSWRSSTLSAEARSSPVVTRLRRDLRQIGRAHV